jgi:putative membrane protein
MFRVLIHWLLSTIALVTASNVIPGFYTNDVYPAFEAALAIGVLNAALGFFAKLASPLAILSFGMFLVVINASMILLASKIVTGFVVYGWVPALWAGVVLGILGMVVKSIMKDE